MIVSAKTPIALSQFANANHQEGLPMPNEETIRTGIVQAIHDLGLEEAARRLGMAPSTLARIGAGGGVRKGTLLTAAAALGLLVSASGGLPLAISTAGIPQA
jgi:hypothetical protein